MLIGLGAMVEGRAGPGRCGYMKSGRKIFACFPFPFHTFKEESEKKTDLLSNSSLYHNQNFIYKVFIINSKIGQLVFPLLFLLSILFGVLMRKKSVQKRKSHVLNGPPPGRQP